MESLTPTKKTLDFTLRTRSGAGVSLRTPRHANHTPTASRLNLSPRNSNSIKSGQKVIVSEVDDSPKPVVVKCMTPQDSDE